MTLLITNFAKNIILYFSYPAAKATDMKNIQGLLSRLWDIACFDRQKYAITRSDFPNGYICASKFN